MQKRSSYKLSTNGVVPRCAVATSQTRIEHVYICMYVCIYVCVFVCVTYTTAADCTL